MFPQACVSHFVHGGVSQHTPGQGVCGQGCTPAMTTEAGSTHPTGMRTCYKESHCKF